MKKENHSFCYVERKEKESTDVNAKLRQAILNKKENNTPENTEDILKSSRKILP